ncbi:MAG: DUF2281 domain-containing protein [Elainella sp.]
MVAQPSDSRIAPSMPPLIAEVIQTMQGLPPEQQQVLDFVKFLEQKHQPSEKSIMYQQAQEPGLSALEAARRVMGNVGDAPSDLSTNLK